MIAPSKKPSRTRRNFGSHPSRRPIGKVFVLVLALFAGTGARLVAQVRAIQPAPPTPALAAPRDVPYPGVMRLAVDATDLDRHIFDVRQTVPVARAGRLTLLYPKWIPGGHSSLGNTLHLVGGLTITANGRPVPWIRDEVEMTAFHVDVPEGAGSLEIQFQFLSPVEPKMGRMVMTPVMLNLQWLSTAFYPAGHYVSRIEVEPSVKLPAGWGFGCALETNPTSEGWVRFKPTTFETLMDSPLFAGRYFRQILLSEPGGVPVRMNVVADAEALLEAGPASIQAHRNLVVQAGRLFGSRHFDHYDFLVAVSDTLGRIGLEHHRSSENRVVPDYFTEWEKSLFGRSLLPHEFVHSWNGKFRRPADLWTPDYQVPMRNSLLWVYEGQTTYWGDVLAARAGLLTARQARELLAIKAANQDTAAGRRWRSLQDTTHDPLIANRRPLPWKSYQRGEDYYTEGELLWLDADTLIREKTGDEKSLDDFARVFFGIDDGSLGPVTYRFEDVVETLNAVVPDDWRGFLESRLEAVGRRAPLDGLTRGGYRLVFTNSPTEYLEAIEKADHKIDFTHSLGFNVGAGDVVSEVIWGGPAYRAGLTQGATLVAVNRESYTASQLKTAIERAARPGAGAIELLVKDGRRYRTVQLDYHDGLRYPVLERIPGTRARLDEILSARP